MKIILLGKGEMLTNLIRGCVISEAEIVGVFRYENLYLSKFQMLLHDWFKPSADLTLIKKHKLKDLKFKSANSKEFRDFILKENVDLIIMGTWSEKLQQETYNMPKIATVNVHPSMLPKYRGPNPYLQAIWHGEKKSGVTFHLVNDKLDCGNILLQDEVEILDGDTGRELKNRTVFKARLLCAELIEKIESGQLRPIVQDEEQATYFKDINPIDMTLNFYTETSEEIIRHIRAFYPFRPTYIQDGNDFWIPNPYKIKITKETASAGEILDKSKHSLSVGCKDGVVIDFSGLKKYNRVFK